MQKHAVLTSLVLTLCLVTFGQPKLKEIIEYHPNSRIVKHRYSVIKPEKKVYHGTYEVNDVNGRTIEKGYFEYGEKISFLLYDNRGNLIKELQDSVLTVNEYFPNNELKSTRKTINGVPLDKWKTYSKGQFNNNSLEPASNVIEGKILSENEIDLMKLNVITIAKYVRTYSSGETDTTFKVYNHLKYPSEARRNKIEGEIYIKVKIKENCEFEYEILNRLGYGIEDQFIEGFELAKETLNEFGCFNFEAVLPFSFHIY